MPSAKSPSYGLESAQYFDHNQVVDYAGHFSPYDLGQLSPDLEYGSLHLGLGDMTYAPMDGSPIYSTRGFSPMDYVISPDMTQLTPPHLSASELSAAEGAASSQRSSTGSPESVRGGSSLPPASGRAPSTSTAGNQRYTPLATKPRPKRRSKIDDESDDDEDPDFVGSAPSAKGTEAKKEGVRRQRIESEQRRRDDLREGYARLKDALPQSNQKGSKCVLLDRAVQHIRYLEMARHALELKLNHAEIEARRLQQVSEALMLSSAEQRVAAAAASAAVQAQVQSAY